MEREALLEAARGAARRAYAPYSRFRVGAAVAIETPSGVEVVTGANVENASYGLTLCAERAALAAVFQRGAPPHGEADGEVNGEGAPPLPKVTHVAVACIDARADAPPGNRSPCGACRQWLAELAPDAVYYLDGVERDLRLGDLLPLAFHLER